MKNITPTRIITEANGGADVSRCIGDAVALAVSEGVDVVMRHNVHDYIIHFKEVIDTIYHSREKIDKEN